MRLPAILIACLTASGTLAATPAAPAGGLDRAQIATMLIEDGYSGVASLRLVERDWTGIGAHNGEVVRFTVDAVTGRLLREVHAG